MENSIRALSGLLAAILVCISIIASAGYIINQSNSVQNIQMKNSTQFQQLEEGRKMQKDLYSTKKNEIERLKKLQEQAVQNGQMAIDSLPSNYITAKQNERVKMNENVAEIQNQINNVQSELSSISESVQSPIDTSNLRIKSESGYVALFQLITNVLNKTQTFKDDPISNDDVITYFFIFISAVFEILAVLLYVLDKKILSVLAFIISFAFTFLLMTSTTLGILGFILAGGMAFVLDMSKVLLMKVCVTGSYVDEIAKTTGNISSKFSGIKKLKLKKTSDTSPAAKIGFEMKDKKPLNSFKFKGLQGIQDEDLKRYVKYMNDTAIDGISQGYMKIAKNIGISAHKASKIKGYLEQKKIIKSDGAVTKIMKNL